MRIKGSVTGSDGGKREGLGCGQGPLHLRLKSDPPKPRSEIQAPALGQGLEGRTGRSEAASLKAGR